MNQERFKALLPTLSRIALFILALIVVDAVGLGLLFYFRGGFQYEAFMESLILFMLLEGCFIGAAGAFMFFGFSGGRAESKAAKKTDLDPATAQGQQRQLSERRASQQRWAISMIAAGLLLIFIGFLTSTLAQI
ncbi:MAG TPA: hypothetical protein VJ249_05315 [Candidatus Bathyarchaeia archaeon]|nr:hypothetical protein [Candidatus Bathyarchaeia archaeon]